MPPLLAAAATARVVVAACGEAAAQQCEAAEPDRGVSVPSHEFPPPSSVLRPFLGDASTPIMNHLQIGAAVEPRLHDLQGHPAAFDRFAGKRAQQQFGAQGADLLQRLRDRGERGVSGGLHVVEADDRELLGHRHVGGLRRLHHPDRLDVGGGEDGRRPRILREQPARASRAWRRPCGRRMIQSGSIGARRRPSPPRTLAPAGAGVEPEQVRLLVAQEGDPAVAERQQVLCRHPAALLSSIVIAGSAGCSRSTSTIGTFSVSRRRISASVGVSEIDSTPSTRPRTATERKNSRPCSARSTSSRISW